MLKLLLFCSLTLISASQQETRSLSLEEAKIIALENNRDIKIQKQNINFSKGDVTKEKGAFDPFFTVTSTYSDIQSPTVSTFVESGEITEKNFNVENSVTGKLPTGTFYNLYNFSVSRTDTNSPIESLSPSLSTSLSFSIGQELLRDFGKGVNETPLFIAKKNVEISQTQLELTISDVLFNLERDYWTLVAAIQNLELEKKALELAEDLERRNTIEVEVGTLPPVAVTQAKSEVALRNVNLINAENLLERSEDQLKNALVLPYHIDIVPTDAPKTVITDNIIEIKVLETAFENRTELIEALDEIEKGRKLVKFYSNQKLPRFSVEALLQFQGLGGDENPDRESFGGVPEPIPDQFLGQSKGFRSLVDRDFPGWTVVGVFSYPLFNRTAKGEYVKASADLNRRIINYQKNKEQIELEVRDAIREVRNSLKKIDAAKTAVELAEEVVMNDEERLRVGIATTREVLESQRDLIDAQTTQIEAVTEYNISLARLEKTQGTLLLKNNIKIEDDEIFTGSNNISN
ncbi:MAG: TolC family protein [Thermodesulfobacteriota bacterium]